MPVQSQFIRPEDPLWFSVLAATAHDFYHHPEYVSFAADQSDGLPRAYLGRFGEETLFVPLIIRRLPPHLDAPSTWMDALSPYGYASPLLFSRRQRQTDPILWKTHWKHFVNSCRDESIISVFLRSHPLLPLPKGLSEVGVLARAGETVVMRLDQSDEELWRQTRNNHRRDIRKLERAGFHAVIDDWNGFELFAPLYRATMLRAGAAPEYLFSPEYFEDLQKLAQRNVHFCKIQNTDGALAAAGIFFRHQEILQFHLSGTADAYLELSPTKLMFDVMRRWAKDQGCSHFHLGGGVGCRDDSLFAFKAGFSHDRATFHTMRLICDPQRYAQVTAASGGRTRGAAPDSGYFPTYRQPQGSQ